MKKRNVALASAILALVLTGAIAPAANATVSQCPSGSMCAWVNPTYAGTFYNGGSSSGDWPANIDNLASSLYNHTSSSGNYYTNANYQGTSLRLTAGQVWENLYWSTDIDNMITSHRKG